MPEQALLYFRPGLAFFIAMGVTLILRRVILRWLSVKGAPGSLPAVVARTFRVPTILWVLAISLSVALRFVALSPADRRIAQDSIAAFIIISLTIVAAGAAVRALTLYGMRQEKPFVVAGLSRTLTYVVVWSLGALFLLNYLDLDKSITTLLTALGVGGIAVALALQDTLANFFAGIHILVEEPISVGDSIRLSSNEEGVVTDIGWRTTRVLTGQNNTIVIPNTKITSGILVNYSLPRKRLVLSVPILVAHHADPDKVVRVVLQEAATAPGVLPAPAPQVFFDPGVTLTHMQFKLEVSVPDRASSGRIQSDLRLAILRRFQAERIPLPEIDKIEVAAG